MSDAADTTPTDPVPVPRWRPENGLEEVWKDGARGTGPVSGTLLDYYRRFTVFLGSHGNFDHWGNPESGATIYVGDPVLGCLTGSFGDRLYWRSLRHLPFRKDAVLTPEGRSW